MALHAERWRALGTGVSVFVQEPRVLHEARRIVEGDLDRLDRACSRFREDSELSCLNRGQGRWFEVGALFLEAIEVGLRAARVTGGAVDPTIGRSLRAVGYDRDFAALAAGEPRRVRFVAAPGWQGIEVDAPNHRVRIPRGVELDLGATAKALGADRAADRVAGELGCGVMVNLGGDVAVAGPPPARGWPIRVTEDHAEHSGDGGQTISIRSGGLATSSTTVRRWPTPGGSLHHILDPHTGRPAAPVWRTASVAAGSCRDANTASTAAIVKGEAAPAWLRQQHLPARLTTAEGRTVRIGDWPAEPRP